jgi:hypothetical protein
MWLLCAGRQRSVVLKVHLSIQHGLDYLTPVEKKYFEQKANEKKQIQLKRVDEQVVEWSKKTLSDLVVDRIINDSLPLCFFNKIGISNFISKIIPGSVFDKT